MLGFANEDSFWNLSCSRLRNDIKDDLRFDKRKIKRQGNHHTYFDLGEFFLNRWRLVSFTNI